MQHGDYDLTGFDVDEEAAADAAADAPEAAVGVPTSSGGIGMPAVAAAAGAEVGGADGAALEAAAEAAAEAAGVNGVREHVQEGQEGEV